MIETAQIKTRALKRVERFLWGGAAAVASFATLNAALQEGADSIVVGDLIPQIAPPVVTAVSDSLTDVALQLLSREFVTSDAPVGPQPQVTPAPPPVTPRAPVLKGIMWVPDTAVIIEGVGLPPNGAILRMRISRDNLTLIGIRGDSAIVRDRDSTWTLALHSRSGQTP